MWQYRKLGKINVSSGFCFLIHLTKINKWKVLSEKNENTFCEIFVYLKWYKCNQIKYLVNRQLFANSLILYTIVSNFL